MQTLESLSSVLSDRLFLASLEGGVVLAFVWLLTRRYGALPPSLQAWLWWAASLKLLVVLVGVPGLPLPVLPAGASSGSDPAGGAARADAMVLSSPAAVGSAPVAARSIAGRADPDPLVAGDSPAPGTTTAATPLPVLSGERAASRRGRITFNPLMPLTLLWVGGVAVALAQLVLSLRRVRRIVSRSRTTDARGLAVAAEIAARLEMTRLPEVRISRDVDVPQATGIWRPVVLLPESAECGWDVETLQMALCHELAHVRRRDLLAGWVPVLASRVFFFHPLAHLALREYLMAREAACDAIVLQTLQAEPASYGRLVVRFGVTAPPAVFTAGGASASAVGLKRRLEMLSRSSFTIPAAYRWLAAAALSLALVPLDLVSRAEASPEGRAPALMAGGDRQLPPQSPAAAAESPQGRRASARDWEDMAAGPCPAQLNEQVPADACLYLGDIGDNNRVRDTLSVHVIPEPRIGGRDESEEAPTVSFSFRYPDGPHDSEALAVLPDGGVIIVSKGRDGRTDFYSVPASAIAHAIDTNEIVTAIHEGGLGIDPDPGAGRYVTAAAMSPDGRTLAVRTYNGVFLFERVRASGEGERWRNGELVALRVPNSDDSTTTWRVEENAVAAGRRARPLAVQSLDDQLRALTRQQSELARQQEALVEAQREIAAQLQRVRDVLEQQRLRQTPER